MEQQPGRWRTIRLPALAEENDPLGREVGEALWPSRYPKAVLETRRDDVGPRDWNSLFQQRPRPEEGQIFRWFPTYSREDRPKITDIVVPIDTAYTRKKSSDYSAWAAWGTDGQRAYLLEAGRTKAETPVAERDILKFYQNIRQRWPRQRITVLYRVGVAIDRIAAQHLQSGITIAVPGDTPDAAPHLKRIGVPAVPVKLPQGSTEEISNMISAHFESERALIPEHASWLADWLDEHKGHPGLHDDWVETTNLALYKFFELGIVRRRKPWQLWPRGA